MMKRRVVLQVAGMLPLVGLAGCGDDAESLAAQRPVPIEDGDSCHMCGMFIARFPGPKGQCYVRGSEAVLKFCSTRDLFGFITQPENASIVQSIFVHDMGATDWERPDDGAFVDARPAFYVICHPLPGAMGPTLASFAERATAGAFATEHGGRIVLFQDIDAERISRLDRDC
jgi:copper chaperone NosL